MSSAPAPEPAAPTCYRHPDRVTGLRCTRCDRPICPDCMRPAAVGQQCVDCVRAGASPPVRRARRTAGPSGTGVAASPVSYTLIALNVLLLPAGMSAVMIEQLALIPATVAHGEFYRLVTSAFLHYGPVHLLFNMWALYLIGPSLESFLGRWRFGALYGLCALGGSVAVYLLSPVTTPTAGASGAIFGLFGATFVVAKRLRFDTGWVALVIILNLAFTFSIPGISWPGHVGGLLTGALVAAAYVYPPAPRRLTAQIATTAIVLIVFAALIWWRTGALASLAAGLG